MCLLAVAAAAEAQVRVSGRTMSDTAAPVAAAEVVVRTPASDAVVARATSDAAGAFVVEVAATGAYRVSVERQGFYAIEHQEVTLAAGADLLLTLLPVREHLESLDVTSRGDPASISQPSTEQSLSGAEAMNVPFNGSHGVKNALRTLPGVVMDGGGGIHVDGARESQTLFVLDGFNVGDPLNGGFDPRVSVEAVQALTVRSGVYAAEFGKGSGGVIEVATHVGGDRLRYSATDFFPTIVREKGLRIQDWTPRLSASGPLARSRAWFSDSFIGEYDQFFVEELPEGQDSSNSQRLSNHLRGQVNLSSSNVLHSAPSAAPASAIGSASARSIRCPRRGTRDRTNGSPTSAISRSSPTARCSRPAMAPIAPPAADAARPRSRSSPRRAAVAATTTTTAARTRSAIR